jgi:hypothetical protein
MRPFAGEVTPRIAIIAVIADIAVIGNQTVEGQPDSLALGLDSIWVLMLLAVAVGSRADRQSLG